MMKLGTRRRLRRKQARHEAEVQLAATAEALADLRRQNGRTRQLEPLPETSLLQMLDQAERTLQRTARRQRLGS